MQSYVVFDLEWNQSANGKVGQVPDLPFEIIEIGAVKLDENFKTISTFRRIIRPVVYPKLHFRVSEVIHLGIEELKNEGEDFVTVCTDFINWCKEGNAVNPHFGSWPIFCTWGEGDLIQLERNMAYHGMKIDFPYPFLYYDVQKLYSISTLGNHKTVLPLEQAVQELCIREADEYHAALVDATYTADVMRSMEWNKVKDYLSLDYYRIPRCKEEEIYLIFPDYSKFVSRAFDTKEDAMKDAAVREVICYRCNSVLKKPLNWFTGNQKQYSCVGYCPSHGFMKGKIKVRHTSDDKTYVIKTIKAITKENLDFMSEKKIEVQKLKTERNRRRRHKDS